MLDVMSGRECICVEIVDTYQCTSSNICLHHVSA